jgi:hypothetical protein
MQDELLRLLADALPELVLGRRHVRRVGEAPLD